MNIYVLTCGQFDYQVAGVFDSPEQAKTWAVGYESELDLNPRQWEIHCYAINTGEPISIEKFNTSEVQHEPR